jgi:CRISPR-associated protein Cas5d
MNGGKPLYLNTKDDIVQRASLVLRDVHYVIEARFEMTEDAAPGDNPGKFQDIVKRRLVKGQAFHTPYLGCREFPARFRLWEGGEVPTIEESRDLGYMLYDMDYSNPEDIQPMFFRAQMRNGVIDLTNCEVRR